MTTPLRTLGLTALAMLAFAANSLLCRLALGEGSIDAVGFTAVRLVSGAATLALIASARGGARRPGGSWRSAAMLFCYALAFSLAYLSLPAGTGALILFGAVQLTMLAAGLRAGERPAAREWTGLVSALLGLVYLVSPGLAAPAPLGSALMAAAGVSWGIYSLRGRGTRDPLGDSAGNFARSVPLIGAVALLWIPQLEATPAGVLLAVASGALASGVGYVIWYAALRGLTAARAATVQLSVPVIAAAGGVALLDETLSLRLLLASALILGGIALALSATRRGAT